MGDVRRNRRGTPLATWVAIAAALSIHALFAATLHAVGPAMFPGRRPRPKPVNELQTGCVGDVVLATSARFSLCFAPWQADVDRCMSDAEMNVWIDLASCQAQRETNVAQLAMLEPKAAERMTSIDPARLLDEARNRAQPQPKPPEVQPQPPPSPPARPAQVVETAKPREEKAPENARFLAEYDTDVKKQTVARGTASEPMIAASKTPELTPKQTPKEASVREHVDQPASQAGRGPKVPGTLAMRNPGAQESAEVAHTPQDHGRPTGMSEIAPDGTMAKKGQVAVAQTKRDRAEQPPGKRGDGGGAPDALNLRATPDVLERALGGGNVDHLADVETGDETALSAKRWVYASFFNRLKRQVAQNWDPGSVWRRNDPGGQVYGYKTRVTEVRVSLSTTGQLAKIVVTTPSGVSDLDDEAMRAFRAAAPFPNPPKELAGADHLITFAFAFYFEIGAPHTSWRVIP